MHRPNIGPTYKKHFNKYSEETWERLKHYLCTENIIPELTAILIDQIMACYNAICQMLYDINIPKLVRCNILFGKESTMEDVFLI